MNRGIVIVSFGERPYLRQLVESIRRYSGLPIRLYTDADRGTPGVETVIVPEQDILWPDHPRKWVRNTNLILARAALDDFDLTLCLNDDMKIVHPGFLEGFDLADRFGLCVPLNPRVYVKYNALGADATPADDPAQYGPVYGPACNVSPMFVDRTFAAVHMFLMKYINLMLNDCHRGTLAFWKASWETGFVPLYLPEQWCLGQSNATYWRNYKKSLQGREYSIEPIMLHWGQAGVREVFKDVV